MSLKLFIDYGSQPSRAVLIFCLLNKIPHEVIETKIMARETKTPEYKKINPFRKVPSILDGDFNLYESHSIIRYLTRTRSYKQHLYPNDPKKMAMIDSYLDVHHNLLRANSGPFIFFGIIGPKMGLDNSKIDFDSLKKNLKYFFGILENFLLKDSKYIFGFEEYTIADISAICEIMQLLYGDFDFDSYPKVKLWMKKMLSIEIVFDVHKEYFEILQSFNSKAYLEWHKKPRL